MLKASVLAFLLLIPFAVASPTINEVMANPLNESNEWVEVYSEEPIDLSQWSIGDSYSNDTIVCSSCTVSGYFLIIGSSASISSINPSAPYFTTDDSKIGNGLSNTADCIWFFSSSYSSQVCWNATTEESSFSLLSGGSWIECENSTPGGLNACEAPPQASQQSESPAPQPSPEATAQPPQTEPAQENIVLKAYLLADVYTGRAYEDLFKIVIKNKQDCSEKDSVKAKFNVSGQGTFYTSSFERDVGCSGYDGTGFWTPEVAGSYTVCGTITETTAGDSTIEDNSVCWRLTAIENSSAVAQQQTPVIPPTAAVTSPSPSRAEQQEQVEIPEEPAEQAAAKVEAGQVSFADTFLLLVQILYKIGLLIR